MSIWETIEELIELVETQRASGENRFLSLLDRLAFQISETK